MSKKREFEIITGGIILPLNNSTTSEIVTFSPPRVSRFGQLTPEVQMQFRSFLGAITPPKTPLTWEKYLAKSFDADLASGIEPEDSLLAIFPENVNLPHQLVIAVLTRLKRVNLNRISFLAESTENKVRSLWIEKTRPFPITLQLAEQMRDASRDLLQLPLDVSASNLPAGWGIAANVGAVRTWDLPEQRVITHSDFAKEKNNRKISEPEMSEEAGLVPFDLTEPIE